MNPIASEIKELHLVLNQVDQTDKNLPCLWNKESQVCEK